MNRRNFLAAAIASAAAILAARRARTEGPEIGNTRTTLIQTTHDGQVIEDVDLSVRGVMINHNHVIVRNCTFADAEMFAENVQVENFRSDMFRHIAEQTDRAMMRLA